jgi:hypothetical protein
MMRQWQGHKRQLSAGRMINQLLMIVGGGGDEGDKLGVWDDRTGATLEVIWWKLLHPTKFMPNLCSPLQEQDEDPNLVPMHRGSKSL